MNGIQEAVSSILSTTNNKIKDSMLWHGVFFKAITPSHSDYSHPEHHMTSVSLPAATANPAPLGLTGFGLTTILLNIHNAGFYELNVMIMGMGVFVGGIAQLLAGIMEYKRGNTFGALAFVAYASFWLSLVFIWAMPSAGLPAADPASMGCYLAIWGVFTFGLFIATLKGKTIGKLVFGSLTVLFGLLALANFTGSHAIHTLAGYEGIFCGGFAVYEALAIVINEKYEKQLLPL